MAIQFVRLAAVSSTSYAAATVPDITCTFTPKRIVVQNEDATPANDAFVSFDGSDDQGHLVGGSGPAARVEYMRQQYGTPQEPLKMWFRKGAGSTPSAITVLLEG